MDGATEQQDVKSYHALNLKFHDMLVDFAGNARLTESYRLLTRGLLLFRLRGLQDGGGFAVSNTEHRAVVRAVAQRDSARAGQLLRQHAAKSRARMHKAAAAAIHRSRNLPTDITVNGRTYRWMDRPLVVVCVDGCQYEYITAAVAAGAAPFLGRLLAGAGDLLHRRLRHAELHQPEQSVDRHRRAALGARHLRQLLLRPRARRGSDDERPAVCCGPEPSSRRFPRPARRSP